MLKGEKKIIPIRTKGRNYQNSKEIKLNEQKIFDKKRKTLSEVKLERVVGFSSNFHTSFHLFEDIKKNQEPILFYISGSLIVMHKFGESKQRIFKSDRDCVFSCLTVSSGKNLKNKQKAKCFFLTKK